MLKNEFLSWFWHFIQFFYDFAVSKKWVPLIKINHLISAQNPYFYPNVLCNNRKPKLPKEKHLYYEGGSSKKRNSIWVVYLAVSNMFLDNGWFLKSDNVCFVKFSNAIWLLVILPKICSWFSAALIIQTQCKKNLALICSNFKQQRIALTFCDIDSWQLFWGRGGKQFP